MQRREFLALATAGAAAAQQKEPPVVASATVDTTPRVGIVLSSFRGGTQHDGTAIPGLEHPRPVDAELTSGEIDAMVRKALDLAATRAGDLAAAVEPDAWVVLKTHLTPENRYLPGAVTDPRIVRTVISYLAERKRGLRFTVAGAASADEWNTEWNGAFDGLSYRKMIAACTARFPGIRFEIVELEIADTVELPVPGKAMAGDNPRGVYRISKIVQQCDRLISIAPLRTDPVSGVALTIANYLGFAPGLKPVSADEAMIDLFSYHPADFAIAGGCRGVEGDGGSSVHHNLVVAGAKAPCVDAVAASAMGFKPADLPFLAMAERKGFGIRDVDSIWTRGNEIEEALRPFRRAGVGVRTP